MKEFLVSIILQDVLNKTDTFIGTRSYSVAEADTDHSFELPATWCGLYRMHVQ
jgi:hypothetical protein